MPRIIGLTGGIATGKSTVSEVWRKCGAVIIDADVIAREVVRPGCPGLRLIRWTFGAGVIRADGTLDRAALGAVVFRDAAQRRRLNRIMHPLIMAAMVRQLALALVVRFAPVVVLDAPLLFESGTLVPLCHCTVVVACEADAQLARLVARSRRNGDPLSGEQARQRVAAQMPLADKIARAHHVLYNDGSLEDLETSAKALLAELRPPPASELAFRTVVLGVAARLALALARYVFRKVDLHSA